MYPNLKKGLVVGLTAGLIAATLVFGLSVLTSTLRYAPDVSLTWSVRTWWRESNWVFPALAFVSVGVVFGVLAAFRPDMKRKR